jgi:hypothetical protein
MAQSQDIGNENGGKCSSETLVYESASCYGITSQKIDSEVVVMFHVCFCLKQLPRAYHNLPVLVNVSFTFYRVNLSIATATVNRIKKIFSG